MNPQPKRRIKLINRDFQYRLMIKFIMMNVVILLLFGALLYIFFRSEISANLSSAHAAYRSVSEMLLPIFLTLSLLNILFTSVIIIILVLYSSHKIAGPLFRFDEALKKITGGELAPLTRIRTDDQLKELSVTLSRMSEKLCGDFARINDITAGMKPLVNASGLTELQTRLTELEQVTAYYKIPEAKGGKEEYTKEKL